MVSSWLADCGSLRSTKIGKLSSYLWPNWYDCGLRWRSIVMERSALTLMIGVNEMPVPDCAGTRRRTSSVVRESAVTPWATISRV